ncbi:AaceriAER073Cp [[Ashbya] aceris (nom. inval.)]|nr:AaceriAER073Cp [[Ashbya] aceris (nom. inval.)]
MVESTSRDVGMLQSLQRFVTMISGGAAASNKNVAFFLRLNLLTQLRQLQSGPGGHEGRGQRDALVQWWITLLNYLNSDLNGGRHHTPAVETVSVALECISRVVTVLMPRAGDEARDFEIYAHHLLLTVHYITNRLVDNSKRRKVVAQNAQLPAAQIKATLLYVQVYNGLLRAFMGKVIAYAYMYLPAAMRYDVQVLRFLVGNVVAVPLARNEVVPWKPVRFELDEAATSQQASPKMAGNEEDLKIFQVMISYLQNDQVFSTFYWHYWYILLQLHLSAGQNGELQLGCCPGALVLLDHVGTSLSRDLPKFAQYMRTQDLKEPSLAQGNSSAALATRLNNMPPAVASDKLNSFVYTKFQSVKIWECLRNLVGCFRRLTRTSADQLLHRLIQEHDLRLLEATSKIPAYDSVVGNLVFNKLLQFIVFQFAGSQPSFLQDLNWSGWIKGLEGMLCTLNSNCQSIALLCLFNIWDAIPTPQRRAIQDILLSDLWYRLTIETEFHIVRILFMKLLVFRVVPDEELDSSLLRTNLSMVHESARDLSKKITVDTDCMDIKNILAFNGNKKLTLISNNPVTEEALILEERKKYETNANTAQQQPVVPPSFPVVSALSNVRPSVVLLKGKYPFDVFDEMVSRAALILADKKVREKMNEEKQGTSRRSSWHSNDDTNEPVASSQSTPSAWHSIISKLSSYHTHSSSTSALPSPGHAGTRGMRSRTEEMLCSDSLDVESGELLSMYSNNSQVSNLTNSSEDHADPSKRYGYGGRGVSQLNSCSQESLPSTQSKKRKLLAPPELKYSSSVTEKDKITHIFRLTTTQTPSAAGSFANLITKLREANDKWGVTANVEKPLPYDKPLPSSPDMPGTKDYTLIDGFDFNSLSSSIMGDIQQISDLSNQSMATNKSTPSLISIPSDGVPEPNWSFLSIFGRKRSPSADDVDTLGNLTITDSKFVPENDTVHFTPEVSVEPSCGSNASSVPCLTLSMKYNENVTPEDSIKRDQTLTMFQRTRLQKFLRIILTYNATVQEFFAFVDCVNDTCEVGNIFMDFDVGQQANRHLKPN